MLYCIIHRQLPSSNLRKLKKEVYLSFKVTSLLIYKQNRMHETIPTTTDIIPRDNVEAPFVDTTFFMCPINPNCMVKYLAMHTMVCRQTAFYFVDLQLYPSFVWYWGICKRSINVFQFSVFRFRYGIKVKNRIPFKSFLYLTFSRWFLFFFDWKDTPYYELLRGDTYKCDGVFAVCLMLKRLLQNKIYFLIGKVYIYI